MKTAHTTYYQVYQHIEEPYLTKRETECAIHLLFGRTVRTTAEILGISVRTAEDFVANARRKLQCNNKNELIFKLTQSDLKETAAEIFEKVKEQF